MQEPKTTDTVEPVEPTPLDKAEQRSERAWNKAGDAVDDLKKLGHEDDEPTNP